MKWTKRLKGRLFCFGKGQHHAIFLENCTPAQDGIWLTDILVGGMVCKAVINWQRLKARETTMGGSGPCQVQLYMPHYEWERGFDDVTLL